MNKILKEMFDIPCSLDTSSNEMPSSKVKLDSPMNIEVKSLNLTMFEIREALNNIGSVAYIKTTNKQTSK